jgi:thiamine-phosphate pyrophosphorylase
MYNIHLYNKYIFLDKYTSDLNYIFSGLKKTNIIYYPQSNILTDELNKINLFCKKRKIKLFVINNFKLAVKIKADGLYLTSNNKTPVNLKFFKNSFELIGSSHNQREYFFKFKQNCLKIFLSPIFYNNKYSRNKILNICKFNLISINWCGIIIPLGGINEKNFGKLKMLKFKEFGFFSYLGTLKNPQS